MRENNALRSRNGKDELLYLYSLQKLKADVKENYKNILHTILFRQYKKSSNFPSKSEIGGPCDNKPIWSYLG